MSPSSVPPVPPALSADPSPDPALPALPPSQPILPPAVPADPSSQGTVKPSRPVKSRRSRGAQPGNQNARTHGFYARRLPHRELEGLDETAVTTLKDEIDVMRVFSRKVAARAVWSMNWIWQELFIVSCPMQIFIFSYQETEFNIIRFSQFEGWIKIRRTWNGGVPALFTFNWNING